jgi:hypothetical protein
VNQNLCVLKTLTLNLFHVSCSFATTLLTEVDLKIEKGEEKEEEKVHEKGIPVSKPTVCLWYLNSFLTHGINNLFQSITFLFAKQANVTLIKFVNMRRFSRLIIIVKIESVIKCAKGGRRRKLFAQMYFFSFRFQCV